MGYPEFPVFQVLSEEMELKESKARRELMGKRAFQALWDLLAKLEPRGTRAKKLHLALFLKETGNSVPGRNLMMIEILVSSR